MKEFRGILDLQVDSMLGALKVQRDRRCREIETAVNRKVAQLLSDSRGRVRKRVHRAVVEERQRRETALLDARHRIETGERRKVQQQYRQFLHDAVPLLAAELEKRWRDNESRRPWCEMLIDEAAETLPREPWTIEHPTGWSAEDTQWIEQAVAARNLPAPALLEDAGITAGLRVRLGGACLDATLDGLITDIHAIEGRLLAAWERQVPAHREDANV